MMYIDTIHPLKLSLAVMAGCKACDDALNHLMLLASTLVELREGRHALPHNFHSLCSHGLHSRCEPTLLPDLLSISEENIPVRLRQHYRTITTRKERTETASSLEPKILAGTLPTDTPISHTLRIIL
jgi:hypothetical protein